MISLAKSCKRKKRKLTCKEPGCKKVFIGYPNQKFCKIHVNPKNRKKEKIKPEELGFITINTTLNEQINLIQRNCDCCGISYNIIIYPGQTIYPRYCDAHTNKYKRELYNKLKKQ